MNIAERLNNFINSLGMKPPEFSRKSGIPYPTLQHYLTGRSEPGAENLQKIAIQFDANLNWLLTGEGDMYRNVKAETGSVAEKILLILKDMPEDEQREILKHVKREKSISELLIERRGKSAG